MRKSLDISPLHMAHEDILKTLPSVCQQGTQGVFEYDTTLLHEGNGVADFFDFRDEVRIDDNSGAFTVQTIK